MDIQLLVGGKPVGARDDFLNLTDMWRAAGADDSRRPADWARKDGAEFIGYMGAALNMPDGHIIQAARGRSGATWAHWQVGLAYAKYLSPAFHAACNAIVRAYMEGKSGRNQYIERRVRVSEVNAAERLIRRFGRPGAREVLENAPAILAHLGIKVDTSMAEALRQHEMDLDGEPPLPGRGGSDVA